MIYNYGQLSNGGFFKRWMGKDNYAWQSLTDCYRTYFGYPDDVKDVKGYTGTHSSAFFPVDIDNKDLTKAFETFKYYAKNFEGRYYFSGSKGFHIEIPQEALGYVDSSTLYQEFKAFAKVNFPMADMAIYDISRLWRIVNTKNSKSGLYKIQIGDEDIEKGLDWILEKAKKPGDTWETKVIDTYQWISNKGYQNLIKNDGLVDGQRHSDTLSLVGLLITKGLDDAAIKLLVSNLPGDEGVDASQIDSMLLNLRSRQEATFKVSSKGNILPLIDNYVLALKKQGHNIRYNNLRSCVEIDGRAIEDADVIQIRSCIENEFLMTSKMLCEDALQKLARENQFNPLQDYLNGLCWDGKPRLDTLLIDQMGAADTHYSRRVTAMNMIGAVKWALNPGCKHDTMLILVGAQGLGKSTFWMDMARGYYGTAPLDLQTKECYISIDGQWIVEFEELATFRSVKDSNRLKAFITEQEKSYRRPFEHRATMNKRMCIFVGSTNNKEFLTDSTGERRYQPLTVHKQRQRMEVSYIDQVWAEAVRRQKEGELSYCINDKKFSQEYDAIIQQHKEVIENVDVIDNFLANHNEFSMKTLLDAMGYGSSKAINDRKITRDIGRVLRSKGLDSKLSKMGGIVKRIWTR